MALFDEHPLSDLDKKAHELLGDKVVVKSLAQQAAFQGLPRYVSEYLIAKYVKPDTWRDDLAKMQAKVKELLPDLEHREFLKERLLSRGEVTLIDNVDARVDLRGGQRWARVPAIQDSKVRVSSALLEQNAGLLLGGLWGTVKVATPRRSTPRTRTSWSPSPRSRSAPRTWPSTGRRGRSSPATSGPR